MRSKIISLFIKNFYPAPKRFAGGAVLNILGYHFIRTLFFGLDYALRRKVVLDDDQSKLILRNLLDDGIVVIPNFFSQDIFEKIKGEYEKLDLDLVNQRRPQIRVINFTGEKQILTPLISKNLAHNKLINRIITAAARKEVLVPPTKIRIEKSFFHEEDLKKTTTDIRSDNLHFDVSYPAYKTLFYLTDTDENNAAFNFVKGSHKLTLSRLWMEYKMSVRFYCLWDKQRRAKETPAVSDSFIERRGMVKTPMIGRANTLIIANVMGLHARGHFLTTTPRHVVMVNYRDLNLLKFSCLKGLKKYF